MLSTYALFLLLLAVRGLCFLPLTQLGTEDVGGFSSRLELLVVFGMLGRRILYLRGEGGRVGNAFG